MVNKTNINLSSGELELLCNKEWIITKHVIIEKVYQLFGTLASSMQQQVMHKIDALPKEAGERNPKISRGENYQSLPYVMLDYPRHFTKESTLAIRTFFWWGNFFSINLHLAGTCKQIAIPALLANFAFMQQRGYWLCVHANAWQHHFEGDNYKLLEDYTATDFATILYGKPFIKIAKFIPLRQWDAAPVFLQTHFNEMMWLLQVNFPAGEKGLLPGIPTTGSGL